MYRPSAYFARRWTVTPALKGDGQIPALSSSGMLVHKYLSAERTRGGVANVSIVNTRTVLL